MNTTLLAVPSNHERNIETDETKHQATNRELMIIAWYHLTAKKQL
jgi:hypothetical protein